MARYLVFVVVMLACILLVVDVFQEDHDLLEGLTGVLAVLIGPLVGWAAGKSVGTAFANGMRRAPEDRL